MMEDTKSGIVVKGDIDGEIPEEMKAAKQEDVNAASPCLLRCCTVWPFAHLFAGGGFWWRPVLACSLDGLPVVTASAPSAPSAPPAVLLLLLR